MTQMYIAGYSSSIFNLIGNGFVLFYLNLNKYYLHAGQKTNCKLLTYTDVSYSKDAAEITENLFDQDCRQ